MEGKTFVYQYSSERNREVEVIRSKYLPKPESNLDSLKRLDAQVRCAGQLWGLTIGVVGLLIFGVGMCIGLGAILADTWLSLLLGAIGMMVMITAYPTYKYVSDKTKRALTPEILRLSEEILNS